MTSLTGRLRPVLTAQRVLLVALIAVALVPAAYVAATYDCASCDYSTFVAGVGRMLVGQPLYAVWQEHPYRLLDAANGQGWIYPPSAGPFLIWIVVTPELAWRLLNAGALWIVLALVMRRNGVVDAPLKAAAVLIIFSPMWIAWSNGQVTPLLTAGMALAWLFPRLAWSIAAVGAAIKLFPAVLLAWIFRERGPVQAGLSVVVMVALAVATIPITGLEAWPAFADALSNGRPNCSYGPVNSIQCTAGPLIGRVPAQFVAMALAASLALWSLRVQRSRLAFMMLCFAVAVAAPDLNRPYWLVMLLGVIVAWPDLHVGRFVRRALRPITRLRTETPADA